MIADVRPLTTARSAEIRALLVAEAGRTATADAPLRIPRKTTTQHPRLIRMTVGVSIAAAGVAVLALAGVLPGAGRPDAAPPVMAAGPVDGLAPASTTTSPCPARTIGTPADAGAARYVINGDLPAALDLQQAWSVVGGCLDAHAAATLLQLSPDGSTVRKALTVWDPDAFSPFSPDAAPTATDVVVGDRPPRLLDRGWGAAIGWSDDRGNWVITASGITSTVVRQAAETVHAAGPAADLAALLPGLASVPLGAPSTDRVVWYASYGDDHGQTPISLSVSSAMPPWQALASTSKPGGALVDVGGAPAVVGGGSTASFVNWQVAPGVQAQLFGDASDMPGGILALANRVAAVSADDPRLIGSRPAQSPASSGVER
jgi:hypothetical protein